jgi:ABC-type branched-subunit amino acid transport system substrate-binding protein
MMDSAARRNPYIIGRPLNEDEPELFFGRENLFHFVEESLSQRKQVIVLHGQRRIGKSSILRQIPGRVVSEQFVFVSFDWEHHRHEPFSRVLAALAGEILKPLEFLRLDVNQLSSVLETDLNHFSREFLPQVNQALGDKNLVLLLDELDAPSPHSSSSTVVQLFTYLQSVVPRQENLFIIAFVGQQSEGLATLITLFPGAAVREISLLDETTAKELITKPVRRLLKYKPEAIQAIWELSAGHPYFTQVICFTLFVYAKPRNLRWLARADVESIVEEAIHNTGRNLLWFWDGLSIPEKVAFSAVAEAQQIALVQDQPAPEDPLVLLESRGVTPTECLSEAMKQLREQGFLDKTGRRVNAELVRRWLVQRYPLRQVIGELENLTPQALDRLSEVWTVAAILRQQGKKQAVELYTRAFQVDSSRHKEGLVRSLLDYGRELLEQQELAQAKQQFARVLTLDPDNSSAQEKLQGIDAAERGRGHKTSSRHLSIALSAIASFLTIIALVGLGAYRSIAPCPLSQQKVLGIFCQANPDINISHGDRTLFSFENNINRDRGVKAFKERKFVEAARFFERARTADPTDPEVLIYYNNALARQRSSRYTLAVVVPVDNAAERAKQVLRGVAQAQNQFNSSRELDKNNPLLEIIIANDGNNPDKAQKLALELIRNPHILGVIGHGSSDACKAALAEYEKAGLALLSPTSTSVSLTGNVFFRAVPSDNKASRKLADYIKHSLGFNQVVIFYNPKSIYSNSLKQEFFNIFEGLGGNVVRAIDLSDPNFDAVREVQTSVSQDKAQAALLFPDSPYTSKAYEIIRANAQLIANPENQQRRGLKLLGGDTLYNPKTLQVEGATVEHLVLTVPWVAKAPQSQVFLNLAKQQWGEQVEISWLTATSFDATQALIAALSADSSRATVLQKLQQVNLSPQQTSGEPLQFTSHRERRIEPTLVRVIGGQFQLVRSNYD